MATSLCAPEFSPDNLAKEEKEVILAGTLSYQANFNFLNISVAILCPGEDSAGHFPNIRPPAGLRLGRGAQGDGERPGRDRGPAPEADL